MSNNINGKTSLLVSFAAISIIGLIVLGALWSGVKLPSFESELDIPIDQINLNPLPNLPPWALGGARPLVPKENLDELRACTVEAQKHLPQFIAAITSPKPTYSRFSICATRHYSGKDTLFWFDAMRTASGRFTGTTIGNYEGEWTGPQYFDWDLGEQEIVDWVYFDDGKMVGGYSAGYYHRNR